MTSEPITVTMRAGDAEVVIYDAIGKSFLEDGFTSKRLADQLKALGRVPTINVRINSPGGLLSEALGIYNALRSHGARVVAHVDGFALSSASLVAMAGDEIRMAEGTWLMVHNPSLPVRGDYLELRAKADLLERFTGSAADIYAKRTGKPREQIIEMMTAETWFDATEAKAQGFANTITPELKVAARFDLADFANVPDMLKRNVSMPTVQEIKAACPGCDDAFVVKQLEAGATVQAAMTAWMAEQQKQLAALRTHRPAVHGTAGVDPLPAASGGPSPGGSFGGDAIAAFTEAVQLEMQASRVTKDVATLRVCRRDPELRKAYVAQYNAQHNRPQPV